MLKSALATFECTILNIRLIRWNIEIIWTGFTSLANGSKNLMGHTSIWMFFIYGAAAPLFLLNSAYFLKADNAYVYTIAAYL